jgi:hypothetical protein
LNKSGHEFQFSLSIRALLWVATWICRTFLQPTPTYAGHSSTRPQPADRDHLSLSNHSSITKVLFDIIESDTLQILQFIRTKLREIDHGTMNDILLQQNLQAWRYLITNIRDVLPKIRESLCSFLSYTRDLYGFQSSQPRHTSQLSSRLIVLEVNIANTLTLAAETQKGLFTNISIIDSKRGIAEAEAVTKLTELAVRNLTINT